MLSLGTKVGFVNGNGHGMHGVAMLLIISHGST